MVGGVPVFGCDFEGEGGREEGVDCGEDGAAVGNCEGPVLCVEVKASVRLLQWADVERKELYRRAEVLLEVHDNQCGLERLRCHCSSRS